MNKKVNILGTEYTITIHDFDKDIEFKNGSCGYTQKYLKEIVLCDMQTFPGWEDEVKNVLIFKGNETLRHEIIHAFLFESGLDNNTSNESWAINEELVDWIAMQFPKIMKIYKELGIL